MDAYIWTIRFLSKCMDFSEPNLSALLSSSISAYYSIILYSTFAYEAFANLLGNTLLPGNFHENYLDRLPALDKITSIIELVYEKKFEQSQGAGQIISKIFRNRDKIVHDKGKPVKTHEEYQKFNKKRIVKIDEQKIINSFLMFDKYLESIGCSVKFLSGLHKNCILEWTSRKKYYDVIEGLLYAHTKFPSLFEYELTVRRHTGFVPKNLKIDEKNKHISEIGK